MSGASEALCEKLAEDAASLRARRKLSCQAACGHRHDRCAVSRDGRVDGIECAAQVAIDVLERSMALVQIQCIRRCVCGGPLGIALVRRAPLALLVRLRRRLERGDLALLFLEACDKGGIRRLLPLEQQRVVRL